MIVLTTERKARAIALALVSVWDNWQYIDKDGTVDEDVLDNALEVLSLQARDLDLLQVSGELASPLKYWTRARLDDDNPEDLTYDEMMQSMRISLAL